MKNDKKRNLEDYNLQNIKGFIQGYYRLFLKKLSNSLISNVKVEQIIYRRVEAKECMQLGECKHCGCEMIGKTMEDRGCELGCYPDMMDSSSWNKFKEEKNIKYFL